MTQKRARTERVDSPNNNANSTNGIYRGIVEVNNDPLKIGRIKARVPAFHGIPGTTPTYMSSNELPWAFPCLPTAGPDHGTMITPEVGDTVWLLFENNQKDQPVWIGCCYSISTDKGKTLKSEGGNCFTPSGGYWNYQIDRPESPMEYQEGNGNVKVLYKSPKGTCISIDETDGAECFMITDRIGQVIKMSCPSMVSENKNGNNRRLRGNIVDNNLSEETAFGSGSILLEINPGSGEPSLIELSSGKVKVTNGSLSVNLGNTIELDGTTVINKDTTIKGDLTVTGTIHGRCDKCH